MVRFVRYLIDKLEDDNSVWWMAGIICVAVYLFLVIINEEKYLRFFVAAILIPILVITSRFVLFLLRLLLVVIFHIPFKITEKNETKREIEKNEIELLELLKNIDNRSILKYIDESKYNAAAKINFIQLVKQVRIDREKMNYSEMSEKYKDPSLKWIIDLETKPFFIKRYETAGRYEEAAQICESLGNHEEAGRLRKLDKTQYVKTSSVNINTLITQLKGLVNYKCPNCGSGIDISSKTSSDGLRFCSHCGSGLNLNLISDYIQKLL